MSKKLLIDARLADETRIVILNQDGIEDVDYESTHRQSTKGNIYLAKVTRVEPSLQACFVEYGGNRQGFLAFNEIHPDYYRIPVEDRERLLEEEKQKALAIAAAADADDAAVSSPTTKSKSAAKAGASASDSGDSDSDSEARLDSIADLASDDSRPRHRFEKFRRQYSIQEVISRNQILLVQVVKEERGSKGAAMTTYLSLAGRYSVLMPNTYHSGGISRKISDPKTRKKLKTILTSLDIPHGMAVIARTAGSGRTKAEFTRDYNRLLKEWAEVRELTLKSSAPTLIYAGANLIKRAVRDYYASDVKEIIVEGETGYKAARDHMKHLSPTHVKKVKQYKDKNGGQHLFQHYKVEQMLAAMHDPRVELKSGGSLVINQTEALVAIDVNSGKATRERSIEETALKTNLEAASAIASQLKQRDLSGLIVIDFIDMEIDRNKHAVVNALRDAMREDKARAQIGNISQFGLLEMSRQRLRPSLSEAMSDICPRCNGTGRVRAIDIESIAIIDRIAEEASRHKNSGLVVTLTFDMAAYISKHKTTHLADIQSRYGVEVQVKKDPTLLASQILFDADDGERVLVDTADGSVQKISPPSGRGKRKPYTSRTANIDSAADPSTPAADDNAAQAKPAKAKPRKTSRRVMPPFARRGGRGRSSRISSTPPDMPVDMPSVVAEVAGADATGSAANAGGADADMRATSSSTEINVTLVGQAAGRDKKTGHWSP